MKKRGFTLVELLAVIAILAILVIMALPAVLRMFNNARKDSFTNEVNTLIRTARQKYLLSGGTETIWTNAEGHINTLDLTGNSKLTYYVQMNNEGEIIKLQVSNGDYQYNKINNNGIDVASSSDVEEVTEDNQLVIDGNGNLPPTAATCFSYTKMCDSVTYDINQETCRNYLINEYEYSSEEATTYCDRDSGRIDSALNNNEILEEEYSLYGLSNVKGTCSSITITGYDETCGTDVVIPSRIDNIPVTIINDGAFAYKGITSAILPNTIIEIRGTRDEGAFEGNLLTSIVIPNSVTTIGGYAFSGNSIASLIIPNSVVSISVHAFSGNLLTSLTIPNNVESIYQSAFSSNKISSLTIGTGLTVLGNYAFANNNLTSLTIPGNITTINDYAFSGNHLTSVNMLPGVNTIRLNAFSDNQIISLTIPSSVETINDLAFSGNNIDTVTISYAPGHEAIISDLYQGGNYGFNFSKLIIENGITTIGQYAFQNNQLTSVTFPNSVTSIGNMAFQNNQLTSITIPNSVTSIGQYAFYNNKLTSITIPNSVTSISACAFNKNQLPDDQAIIYKRTSSGIDTTTIVSYGGTNPSPTIPDGVKTIESGAFLNSQLTSITIPSSVTAIKGGTFSGNKLTSVTIKGKTRSTGFTTYEPSWGWASDVTCVTNNTSNVTNGCITWGA